MPVCPAKVAPRRVLQRALAAQDRFDLTTIEGIREWLATGDWHPLHEAVTG